VSLSVLPAFARNSYLAMVACDDPTPLRHWFDSQAHLGATLLSNSRLASNPAILEAYSLPWEDDLLVSPGSNDGEASDSRVADSVDLSGSEVTLAKVVRGSPPAKSFIRQGFWVRELLFLWFWMTFSLLWLVC
jgi:hypothetical protein